MASSVHRSERAEKSREGTRRAQKKKRKSPDDTIPVLRPVSRYGNNARNKAKKATTCEEV